MSSADHILRVSLQLNPQSARSQDVNRDLEYSHFFQHRWLVGNRLRYHVMMAFTVLPPGAVENPCSFKSHHNSPLCWYGVSVCMTHSRFLHNNTPCGVYSTVQSEIHAHRPTRTACRQLIDVCQWYAGGTAVATRPRLRPDES